MAKVIKLFTVFIGLAMLWMPAQAYEAGTWIVKGGATFVQPEDTAWEEEGDKIIVDDGSSFGITGTYMFTPNWGLDILAAWPFEHDVKLNPGGLGEIKIAEVTHLPPTVSVQYHFLPDSKWQPYAGLGLNYTFLFDEDVEESVLPGYDLDVDGSFGFAAQLGLDYQINEKWLFHIDARYISIEPDATLSGEGQSDEVSLDINPMVYSIGFGRKFD